MLLDPCLFFIKILEWWTISVKEGLDGGRVRDGVQPKQYNRAFMARIKASNAWNTYMKNKPP